MLSSANSRLRSAVLDRDGGADFMRALGFDRVADADTGRTNLVLRRQDLGLCWMARELLQKYLAALPPSCSED